jgi:hypothetical protein
MSEITLAGLIDNLIYLNICLYDERSEKYEDGLEISRLEESIEYIKSEINNYGKKIK